MKTCRFSFAYLHRKTFHYAKNKLNHIIYINTCKVLMFLVRRSLQNILSPKPVCLFYSIENGPQAQMSFFEGNEG